MRISLVVTILSLLPCIILAQQEGESKVVIARQMANGALDFLSSRRDNTTITGRGRIIADKLCGGTMRSAFKAYFYPSGYIHEMTSLRDRLTNDVLATRVSDDYSLSRSSRSSTQSHHVDMARICECDADSAQSLSAGLAACAELTHDQVRFNFDQISLSRVVGDPPCQVYVVRASIGISPSGEDDNYASSHQTVMGVSCKPRKTAHHVRLPDKRVKRNVDQGDSIPTKKHFGILPLFDSYVGPTITVTSSSEDERYLNVNVYIVSLCTIVALFCIYVIFVHSRRNRRPAYIQMATGKSFTQEEMSVYSPPSCKPPYTPLFQDGHLDDYPSSPYQSFILSKD